MKPDAQKQKLHVILAVVESTLDEHGLPELPLQSRGQNEGSLSHFRHRELRAGSLHQVGKVLEKMHKDDLKAMSFETEERYLPNPR